VTLDPVKLNSKSVRQRGFQLINSCISTWQLHGLSSSTACWFGTILLPAHKLNSLNPYKSMLYI